MIRRFLAGETDAFWQERPYCCSIAMEQREDLGPLAVGRRSYGLKTYVFGLDHHGETVNAPWREGGCTTFFRRFPLVGLGRRARGVR